jgi:hypothetical protein
MLQIVLLLSVAVASLAGAETFEFAHNTDWFVCSFSGVSLFGCCL